MCHHVCISRWDEQKILCYDWPLEWARQSYIACSGITSVSHPKIVFFFHLINPLLTKLVRLRWLDIGLVLFWMFKDLDSNSVHKNAKYPGTFKSSMVNNPYYIETQWLMNMYLAASAGIAWLATSASNSCRERQRRHQLFFTDIIWTFS